MKPSMTTCSLGVALLVGALLACKKKAQEEPTVETRPAGTSPATAGAATGTTTPPPAVSSAPSEVFYPPVVPIPQDSAKPVDDSPRTKKLKEERLNLRLKLTRGSATARDIATLKSICKQLDDETCFEGIDLDAGKEK